MIAARRAAGSKSPLTSLAAVAMAFATALSAGCDDSSTTMEALGVSAPSRSTPEGLLRAYMPKMFAMRDSAGVAEMLHGDFTGLTLLEGGDSFAWDRTLYLQAIGSQFRDSTIIGINLSVSINDNQPSTDEGCPDCRVMSTTCTERVSRMGNSNGPVTYTMDTPVTFYVTHDPRNEHQWVLWKLIARERQFWS